MSLIKWKRRSIRFENDRWLKWKMAYIGIDSFLDNLMNSLKGAVLELPYRETGTFGIYFRVDSTHYEVQYQLFNEEGERCVKFTKLEPLDIEDELMLNRIKQAIKDSRNDNRPF